MATSEQDRWVRSVLGVGLAADPPTAGADADLSAIWRQAREQVDGRLAAVQSAMRGLGDPELDRIADYGLFGVGTTEAVQLSAALVECRSGTPKAAEKLRKAATALRALLDGNETVALLDDNPFGVAVRMRSTLGGALDTIMQAAAR